MVKPLLEETETVSATYMFLSSISAKAKAARLNAPLKSVLKELKEFDKVLKSEIEGQKGMMITKIKEELDHKSENRKTVIARMKSDNEQFANSYHDIIDTLRKQNVTLHYKKNKPLDQ
ncbi:hypothetical protein [Bacillus haynesii]|uniref:hypothetical protein n=1 Tax=Bacillus haynesii TaxID=1925021 RepID=UPI00227DD82A|nr:hypothetical protein [Bacillus haynesii]MCY7911679.1 hypothetical protein [Bacillus haynesii]MCY7925682.1 hypothetical protein [Bacillus haynesii]MCY8000564.1 hypothetical protein [Bacillus haynesii]MCY8774141.1 hypothetical protein [Bacillus haynesii]MCY9217747.1 hypothetical protein [Bacillus haynesii]